MKISLPKVQLGKTKLRVGRIGLGLSRISGGEWGINVPGEQPKLSRKGIFQLFRYALRHGVNFFDLAPVYEGSEEILSDFLRVNPEAARQIIISTKFGYHFRSELSEKGRDYHRQFAVDFSYDAAKKSIERSLHLLEHIHLLSLHSITAEAFRHEDTLKLLEGYREAGDVEYIGITSTSSPEAVKQAIEMGIFSVLQAPYNLIDQTMEEVMHLAHNKGMGTVANRPLATGVASPKLPYLDRTDPQMRRILGQVQPSLNLISDNIVQRAWSHVFGHPAIDAALVGTRNRDHLKENIMAVPG